ncbi:hypothetical protein MMG00_07225 [Ignatzschineria rhizosphaerae]|uniref:Uncharacterized protein n=1 Tax=Ignatzschineria rhizosphaerae TaxID=2923279 RepID=A0ABY3XA98_9GAMM|nr:hypothetical protein [Ignatzschineria rhizosphaerae]UNM97636.1 hypothetical protein MMG00_07225 [Ignatzschineria rhizosphaerae]
MTFKGSAKLKDAKSASELNAASNRRFMNFLVGGLIYGSVFGMGLFK